MGLEGILGRNGATDAGEEHVSHNLLAPRVIWTSDALDGDVKAAGKVTRASEWLRSAPIPSKKSSERPAP
jgi:hypothetical protein